MAECPRCKQSITPTSGARFCPRCGIALQVVRPGDDAVVRETLGEMQLRKARAEAEAAEAQARRLGEADAVRRRLERTDGPRALIKCLALLLLVAGVVLLINAGSRHRYQDPLREPVMRLSAWLLGGGGVLTVIWITLADRCSRLRSMLAALTGRTP